MLVYVLSGGQFYRQILPLLLGVAIWKLSRALTSTVSKHAFVSGQKAKCGQNCCHLLDSYPSYNQGPITRSVKLPY